MRKVLLPLLVGSLLAGWTGPVSANPIGTDTETTVSVSDGIEVRQVRLYDPLPDSVGSHPAACDSIDYLRYRFSDGPDDPQRADTVLLAQPAAFMGAFSLDQIARNSLNQLRSKGTRGEWWSLPQRSGCAFDNTGLASGDATQAFDYYFDGGVVDGKRFDGFRPGTFLADIGLRQMAHDEYTVLTRQLPSARFRSERVFCGGHADGALATAAFAAWDFEGTPGYSLCAGFFGLDGLINTDWLGLGANPLFQKVTSLVGSRGYLAAVQQMRNGVLPTIFAGMPAIGSEAITLLPIAGLNSTQLPLFKVSMENVDLHTLAGQLSSVSGVLGYVNPYYTTRFFLDLLGAFGGDRAPDADFGFLKYEAEVRNQPRLTVIGTASMQMDLYPKLGLLPADTVYIPGYTHQDVVAGTSDTDPVGAALTDFVTARLEAK
ncbi:hypothetical protein AB0N05_02450 [Nocardia sp. NPDC051030]|uniref:hypothetical protein n=1 Tax=Nocardia sp. NPDC051030 TaxID=3155162 RepID=UPI00343C6934